jgi:hypothetical protein
MHVIGLSLDFIPKFQEEAFGMFLAIEKRREGAT